MPEAFSLGPFVVPTLRVGVLVALLLGAWFASRFAQRQDLDAAWVSATAEWSVWLGLAGARLGFVLANWQAYTDAPWTALYVWQPGYLLSTGVFCGAAYTFWRLWRRPLAECTHYLRVIGGGFAVTALLVSGLFGAMRLDLGSSVLREGDTVPNITLQDLEGNRVSLEDLSGRAVVLNFWATWCPPCRREMPILDGVNNSYDARGVTVIGIDVGEPAPVVKRYVESIRVNYPIWVDAASSRAEFDDTRALFNRFGGVGFPTTVFIDAEGEIRAKHVGELSRGLLQSRIEAMLKE